jgi:hypothetical protein
LSSQAYRRMVALGRDRLGMEGIGVGLAVGGDGFTIGCAGRGGWFPGFSGGGVTITSGG